MTNKDWHDSYVRDIMEYPIVYQQLLAWVAPKDVLDAIELEKVTVENGSFVDKKLSKTFSDIVLDCPLRCSSNKSSSDGSSTNQSPVKDKQANAKIVVLLEHQSKPEKLLAIRVHHYMMSILGKLLKKQSNDAPLPAIYPIIYYNGKSKHYPYSTKLQDCVYGPKSALQHFSTQDIQVVNVNEISDEQTAQHQLAGIMACAMKRTTKAQTPQNYANVLKQLSTINNTTQIPAGFTESTIRYMMNVKTVDNLEALIEQNQKLPETVKGEAMTIAEAFELRGEQRGQIKGKVEGKAEGKVEGKIEVAINLLKRTMPVSEVAEITNLEASHVAELNNQLNEADNHKPH